MGDQFVHDRPNHIRTAPLDPARQVGQRHRAIGFPDHVQDPIRQGLPKFPGDPPGPAIVHHVALEHFIKLKGIVDPNLAEYVGEDPDELGR